MLVVFWQQTIKIVLIQLLLCSLLIVCLRSSRKVLTRRRGIPSRRIWVPVWKGFFRGLSDEGLKGTFIHGAKCTRRRRNPPMKSKLGGSNEDGEKSSPRLSGRTCRSFGDAGCRSSRQGQAGRIREDLQPLR